jgi:hypothetical protein
MLAIGTAEYAILLGGLGTLLVGLAAVGSLAWAIRKETRKVHVLVNSQMTDVNNRVAQLKAALIRAGIAIPDDPADH